MFVFMVLGTEPKTSCTQDKHSITKQYTPATRNYHIVFHSNSSILHSYQIHKGSNFSTYWPIFVIFCFLFFMVVILMVVSWYITVVLICIFLISDAEHLFMCLLDICISLEKCLFKFFAHFCTAYSLHFVHKVSS